MTKDELIKDIRATFPALPIKHGLIGAEPTAVMPDRLPIFGGWEDDGYADGVHEAFATWLANRGFYLESEDGFWHQPAPLPTEEERAAWAIHMQQVRASGPFEIPF